MAQLMFTSKRLASLTQLQTCFHKKLLFTNHLQLKSSEPLLCYESQLLLTFQRLGYSQMVKLNDNTMQMH